MYYIDKSYKDFILDGFKLTDRDIANSVVKCPNCKKEPFSRYCAFCNFGYKEHLQMQRMLRDHNKT